MERIFTDFTLARWWIWPFFGLAVVCFLALVFSDRLSSAGECWVALSAFLGVTGFLGPTVFNSSRMGHKHVPTVCVWVAVWLIIGIVTFYFWYFRWIPINPTPVHDRVLNVVPAAGAVVAAWLGWYVHFQYSSKANRTNNAFTMVMEMRRSAEFLKRNEIVVRHFPYSLKEIPDDYVPYFGSGVIRQLHETAKASGQAVDTSALEKAEAISALKYILNYYEFMAAGVKANDLDSELLLDTVSEIVISTYKRSAKLIKYMNDPTGQGQGQLLAYQCLRKIVGEWGAEITQREADEQKAKAKLAQARGG